MYYWLEKIVSNYNKHEGDMRIHLYTDYPTRQIETCSIHYRKWI